MLQLESYIEHERHLPRVGKFIIAQFDHDSIVIYQAFKDSIAAYAVANQRFGGEDYEFNRMTWLKPSFLWMMYYSGWAKKQDQENVLAIRIGRNGFDEILRQAVMSTFYKDIYENNASWKKQVEQADVQLQWEPYHDLIGNMTDRKAVKIGIKGDILQRYNEEWILNIENVTSYVKQQQQFILSHQLQWVELPKERVYTPNDLTLLTKIDGTTISM